MNSPLVPALKEWAVVCRALEEGRQLVLLRKGGIMEYKEGFKLVNSSFLLFPTLEHQSFEDIQEDYAHTLGTALQANCDGKRDLTICAEVSDIRQISNEHMLPRLEKYHIWSRSYVGTRMKYNPKKSMNMIILRVYKMSHPISIYIKPEWSGCKSWISIEISEKEKELLDHSQPVLDDDRFQHIRSKILESLN
jgi:hypothetical protein